MARPKATNPRTKAANVRLTEEERSEIEAAAAAQGNQSVDVKVYIDGNEMTQKAVVAVNDQIVSRITGRPKK